MTRPPDDSDRTWHVHDDDTWGWDIHCDVCYTPRVVTPYRGPNFAIEILKRQNREGRTSAEEEREVLDGVKPEDRDKIIRAR